MTKKSTTKRICITGAGPSGLVALKEMLAVGHDAVVLEKNTSVGGVFGKDAGTYDSLYLTTSNFYMAYSDFAALEKRPAYISKEAYTRYLEAYCDHFDLWPHIKFGCTVMDASLDDGPNGNWRVTYNDRIRDEVVTDDSFESLVVAGGAFQNANKLSFEGFTGQVLHSTEYRNAENHRGERVLVVGTGESSCDVSSDVAAVAEKVVVYTRSTFLFAPRFPLHWLQQGKDYCETEMMEEQFHKSSPSLSSSPPKRRVENDPEHQRTPHTLKEDCAGVLLESHSTNRAGQIMPIAVAGLIRRIRFWAAATGRFGESARLQGLWSCHSTSCDLRHFFMADQSQIVTKNGRVGAHLESKKINIVRAPRTSFSGRTVTFHNASIRMNEIVRTDKNGEGETFSLEHVDTIIACTGFKTMLPWLRPGVDVPLCPRKWYKHCFPPGLPPGKLAFLGWTRGHQGGIPSMSEMLSRYIALVVAGDRVLPDDYEEIAIREGRAESEYYVGSPKVAALVDYPSFMDAVAEKVGCVPRPPLPWKTPLLFVKFWFMAHYSCWYRQRGPGARPESIREVFDKLPIRKSFPVGLTLPFYGTQILFMLLSLPLLLVGEIWRRATGHKKTGLTPGWLYFKSKYNLLHS